MANRYAVATGVWSDTATWDGGTLPTAGDVVRPNTFVVTIDQDITVDELTNNAAAPAVAGGSFVISTSRTIASDILCRHTATLCTMDGAGTTVVITGDVAGNPPLSSNGTALIVSAQSTLTVIGDVLGGALGGTTAGASLNYGISITAASVVVNVTGSVVGGGQNTGSGFNAGINCGTNLCTINVTGSVIGSAWSALSVKAGIYLTGLNGTINITGTVSGNVGNAVTTTQATTNVYVNGVINSLGAGVPFSVTRLNVSGVVIYSTIVNSLNGITKFIVVAGSDVRLITETEVMGDEISLYTAGLLTGYPLEAKVEADTVFGPSDEFEGTLQPVNVDTAQLAEDLLNEISTSNNALAERLRNVSTVQTTGTQISALTIS